MAGARGRPLQALLDREVQDQREIGRRVADHRLEQRVDHVEGHAMAVALVRGRGIGETVADHPATSRQGRPDRAFEMVGAGSGVQEGLGDWSPAIGVALDQQLADAFGAGAPPGSRGLQRRRCRARLAMPPAASICVDLPAPSPPSSVMNRPRALLTMGGLPPSRAQPCGETRYFSVAKM